MNPSDNLIKLLAGVVCAVVLCLVVWAWHHWPDTKEVLAVIMQADLAILTGLGIYHAATQGSTATVHRRSVGGASEERASVGPGAGQAGRARLSGLAFVVLVAALTAGLSGCAGPANAVAKGLMSQEASNVRGTDDNLGDANVWAFCHMSLDWHQRHPQYQAARDSLCGPMASSGASAADVTRQVRELVGALRDAGVTLAPAR